MRRHRARYPGRSAAYQKALRAANPERARRRDLDWYHRNAERVNLEKKLRRYGLTRDEYFALVADHAGRCGICGEAASLHIDHDHVSGRVRGLLCQPCNMGLGCFEDDPDLLGKAIAWLD